MKDIYKSYIIYRYYDSIIHESIMLMLDCAYGKIEISECLEKYKISESYQYDLQKWLFGSIKKEEIEEINLLSLKPIYNENKTKELYNIFGKNNDIENKIERMSNNFTKKYQKLLCYFKKCQIDKKRKEYKKEIEYLQNELEEMKKKL